VGLKRTLSRHAPRTGWLLLAVAIAVPVGIAAAHARHATPTRHGLRARHIAVHYLSRGLSQTERGQLGPVVAQETLNHGTIHADLDRTRALVSVTLGRHGHVYYMAPLAPYGVGGCFFEITDRHSVGDSECGYDPKSRSPAVSEPGVVGSGTALGAEVFPVGGPVQVVIGHMPAKRAVVSVKVRFEDGTTSRAPTNGTFFSYVVFGSHLRAGHRPTALLGMTAAGDVTATQPLGSSWFG
jgi:hypothetical protein